MLKHCPNCQSELPVISKYEIVKRIPKLLPVIILTLLTRSRTRSQYLDRARVPEPEEVVERVGAALSGRYIRDPESGRIRRREAKPE